MHNNVCSDIFWYGDMLLHVWEKMYEIYGKKWSDDIINSLVSIFISTVQEMLEILLEITKLQNFIFSLLSIQFTSYFHCSIEICYSFLLIKLNLAWMFYLIIF